MGRVPETTFRQDTGDGEAEASGGGSEPGWSPFKRIPASFTQDRQGVSVPSPPPDYCPTRQVRDEGEAGPPNSD